MRTKSLYVIAAGLILSSCSTKDVKINSQISFNDVNKIELGTSKEKLQNLKALSTEIEYPSKEDKQEHWFFYGQGDTPWQRGTISFDAVTNLVSSKDFLPFEGESEKSLDFLTQTKFTGLYFEKAKLKMCHRHYIPVEAYYINIDKGVVIKHNEHKKHVAAITWLTREDAKKFLEDIKSCRK